MGRLPPWSTPRGADAGASGAFHEPQGTLDLANQPDESLRAVLGGTPLSSYVHERGRSA